MYLELLTPPTSVPTMVLMTGCMQRGPACSQMLLSLTEIKVFFSTEPRCGVALVSDGRTGPPDLERGSPSCPPPTNDNPPTDRGGADSETESDADDP